MSEMNHLSLHYEFKDIRMINLFFLSDRDSEGVDDDDDDDLLIIPSRHCLFKAILSKQVFVNHSEPYVIK